MGVGGAISWAQDKGVGIVRVQRVIDETPGGHSVAGGE